ncbi:DUF222 domain-containing protein [Tessaracoccus sp. HDW20]|uniref:DUF222 domain-containing protein n=1 Tax=Tessaracoccus coleopterorum TaxID=2714950 RepID=UPI0018D341ED|nr:DUF222 domain-containing protein [Tessaracoccus coleopterorum]NHB83766.1 DUF222 domain-containing protein [Tessaracoccus coleopterorum]
MEDTVVTDGLEDLDHLPADVAARLSNMPIEHRATALTHLKRVADQLCGIYLDELHHLSLDTPPAVFNAVDHLHETNTVTRREATAQYKLAAELADRYPRIGAALRAGTMSLSQVQAVVRVLRHSPLGVDDMTRAQELLVDHADRFDPIDLAEMARRITELLDPDAAEEREAERLQREERLAQQERFLTVEPDHHGSMRIAGKVTPWSAPRY